MNWIMLPCGPRIPADGSGVEPCAFTPKCDDDTHTHWLTPGKGRHTVTIHPAGQRREPVFTPEQLDGRDDWP